MRVLVTGATGFVGRRLIGSLVARGHQAFGTCVEDRIPDLGVELLRADLTDRAALGEAVRAFRPDRIAHLAGLSHVGASFDQADLYHRINVLGTVNLIEVASGVPIVLASSSEVYGPVPDEEQPIPETRLPRPQSPYAESKVASERLVLEAAGLVVRCFNVVGPGQHPSFALPAFAQQLAEMEAGAGQRVLRVGNLDVWRDFVPIEDATDGYSMVLEQGEPGGVYNLGTGKALALRELVDRLIEISGVEAEIRVDSKRFRPVDARKLLADNGRLRALGWEPRHGLDDVLGEIWREARRSAGQRATPI